MAHDSKPPKRIALPDKLDLHNVLTFARQLDSLDPADAIGVDMGKERYFPPFSMLFVAAKFLEFRERHPECRLHSINQANHSYASHMGFFRAAGFDESNDLGEAGGSARYLPIRALYKSELRRSPSDKYAETGKLVEDHAKDIAKVVSQDVNGTSDFYNAVSYSAREMMRNVFEHSECDRLFYCAQYWPAKSKVEVCILDRGIGIRQSLGTNPNFRFRTDKEALELSLWPGVSGKTHIRSDSEWANSGYGLYMTSRLSRHGGNFAIASGDTLISLSNTLGKLNLSTKLQGTAIRMNLDTTKIGDVAARLKQFRLEAPSIAARRGMLVSRNPSYMSMVLRSDFKEV
jgi:hypothetical protein